MTIPLSYIIDGNTITEDFVLSCIYTEYSHSVRVVILRYTVRKHLRNGTMHLKQEILR